MDARMSLNRRDLLITHGLLPFATLALGGTAFPPQTASLAMSLSWACVIFNASTLRRGG